MSGLLHQRLSRTSQTDRQRQASPSTKSPPPTYTPAHPILQLQQTIGNQAVQRLIQSRTLQAKLAISQPGDIYEQEADRVAEQVMRMPAPTLQRTCAPCAAGGAPCPKCEDEKKGLVQPVVSGVEPRKTESASDTADGSVPDNFLQHLGPGQPLGSATRAYFEPRFGHDFSQVRVHTNTKADESARAVNALAFTVGRDVVFGDEQYVPGTSQGRRLLAHELAHVVQQAGTNATVQCQHVPDTGFRYTPPATVTRSIIEIQGIVGTTPDGVYGENTRRAVEKYQTKLKAVGFYSDTLDGKWGNNTEAAHVAFATAPNVERRGYNCAGFAFKDYQFHDLATTKAIYATMTKLADCSKPCSPYFHKFWFWEYDLKTVNTTTGASSPTHRDFHTVGGQTDKSGKGPDQVMSKNGQRPVEGPKPPLDWKPITGPTSHSITGLPVPGFQTVRTGHIQECFCNDKLP